MKVEFKGKVYRGEELVEFSTGAIFIKPLKKAYWPCELQHIFHERDDMSQSIDLNDIVSVELTEWGATYLNATNIFKNATDTNKYHYKTDYKTGDIYECQFYELIWDFKDGIRFDKNKVFKKLKKVSDYGMGGSR